MSGKVTRGKGRGVRDREATVAPGGFGRGGPALTWFVGLVAAPAVVALIQPQAAGAQTFDDASLAVLLEICTGINGGTVTDAGPNLEALCGGNAPAGVVSASPATVSPQAGGGMTIERRLQAVRESEERRREAGLMTAIPASYTDDHVLPVQMQLPPAGGATPEIVISRAQGLSVFASAGATALNHHNNRFEDGYEAQLPTVTVGADYWITPRLLAGIGFNYTNFDGTYDDGGGFDKDIFSPLLYATFLPFDHAFINAVLGYSRNENSNNRRVVVPRTDGSVFNGHTSSDYAENQYSATVQAGYDHPIDNFTIGPRLGFAYGYSKVDSFKENGNTGAELRYSGLDQTSVQTSLGAAATVAIATPYGTLLPQVSASWVHEYANDARNMQAQYVDAPSSPEFTFQRESPARNWANIALGISASLLNGMEPFAQFVTMQGNENFVSYGGTIGLRYSF